MKKNSVKMEKKAKNISKYMILLNSLVVKREAFSCSSCSSCSSCNDSCDCNGGGE